jgi:IS1 family transposase
MAVHTFLFLLVCFLILAFALLRRLACLHLQASDSQSARRRTMVHRLKPRTPLDGLLCHLCSSKKNSFGASLREEVSSPGCLITKGQPALGLERARRIIHHILWQYPRTQHRAHRLIHSLQQRLAPGCLPLFTSDGLNLYFYALTAHFGHWLQVGRRGRHVRRWQVEPRLIYGQVKKSYRRRKLVRVTQVMRLGTENALKATLQGLGFSGRLNTAFIERVNLTVRHGIASLARRTWATAQQSPQLLAQLEWWRAYYHFVRPHASLSVVLVQPRERGDKLLAQRYRHRTPAMAAGRTNRPWTAGGVLSCPLPKVSA